MAQTKLINVGDVEVRIGGGILRVAEQHGDQYRFLDDPAPIIQGLRTCGERVDLFRFSQRLPEAAPKFPYLIEWENYAVLPITTYDIWWTKVLGFKARNKAKQAEKNGVLVREVPFDDALVAGIVEINNETPIRQRRRFPHYGKSFDTVRREVGTFRDCSVFIGAFFENKLIGFVKLVPDETNTQAGLMNIISMIKHRDKCAQNALVAYAVRACAARGIGHLVYSKFDYGKKEGDGLRDFKERNGFKRIDMPRYYVPLTMKGSVAFRLGLHHKISDRVPEAFAKRLRDIRAGWYERKYRSVVGEV